VRKALTRGQREQWLPIAVILGMGMCPAWSIFFVGHSILSPSQSSSFGRATILTKIVLLIWWSSFLLGPLHT